MRRAIESKPPAETKTVQDLLDSVSRDQQTLLCGVSFFVNWNAIHFAITDGVFYFVVTS